MTRIGLIGGCVAAGLVALTALYVSGPLGGPAKASDPSGKPNEPGDVAGDHVRLDAGQMRYLVTQTVRDESLPTRLRFNGKVGFNEDQTAPILAPVGGQVTGLRVKVGDHVSTGDVLFLVKSREVAAVRSEYLESRNDLELAHKTCAMKRELFKHQAEATISMNQAENDLAKARTHVVRTEEQLRVLGVEPPTDDGNAAIDPRVPIRSPLSGIVVERHVTEGQYVPGDSTALMTIADLSSVWIVAEVFERDLQLVKTGQKARVETLAYPDAHFAAQVSNISNVVDPQTRTVKVRLAAPNPDLRLKPEMFASVALCVAESERGITLPARAVLTQDGRSSVFVRVAEREFARRPVELAPLDAGRVRVMRGLKSGEQVVCEGALLLRQEQEATEH